MARMAKHEGLATAGCYHLDSTGFVSALVFVEVFKSTYMMNFDLIRHTCGPTMFTDLGQEPLFSFRLAMPQVWRRVVHRCLLVPDEWDTPRVACQWLLSLARDAGLKPFVGFSIYLQRCSIGLGLDPFPYRTRTDLGPLLGGEKGKLREESEGGMLGANRNPPTAKKAPQPAGALFAHQRKEENTTS
jgi:hypothetical protein